MDRNTNIIKRYLKQGKKPNLEFRREIQYISEEFLRISEI